MKEINTQECKKLLFDMLVNVAEFCEAHGLKYSLGYGTLIGAVRHKGFIPWDDDIDIIMARDDYEKFKLLYNDERYEIIPGERLNNHAHIRVSDSKTLLIHPEGSFRALYYKDGLFIDVFPIDKVPDSEIAYKKLKKKIARIYTLQQYCEFKRNSRKARVIYTFFHRTAPFWGKQAYNLMTQFNSSSTNTVANLGVWYLPFPSFPAHFMREFVDIDFEGKKFKAISNYDTFLRGIYGDYMQLPPREKQQPHHDYKAYWKD